MILLLPRLRISLAWLEQPLPFDSFFHCSRGGFERGLALGTLAILGSALALGWLVCARPGVRAEGPGARDEADDHAADHQRGDAEAQDPTQDSGLRKGFHRSGVPHVWRRL